MKGKEQRWRGADVGREEEIRREGMQRGSSGSCGANCVPHHYKLESGSQPFASYRLFSHCFV